MIIRAAEVILAFIGIIIFFKLGLGILLNTLLKKIETLIKIKNKRVRGVQEWFRVFQVVQLASFSELRKRDWERRRGLIIA